MIFVENWDVQVQIPFFSSFPTTLRLIFVCGRRFSTRRPFTPHPPNCAHPSARGFSLWTSFLYLCFGTVLRLPLHHFWIRTKSDLHSATGHSVRMKWIHKFTFRFNKYYYCTIMQKKPQLCNVIIFTALFKKSHPITRQFFPLYVYSLLHKIAWKLKFQSIFWMLNQNLSLVLKKSKISLPQPNESSKN